MSEEEDVVCEQCATVPVQFVILDCDHKFCLYCIAQAFHKDDSGVPCIKCNVPTVLDPETIQALLQLKQPIIQSVKPFTTEKRQHVKPIFEELNIRGHPFIEKLNVAMERSLDSIRTLQFDKITFKEKCQKVRGDLDQEFKQLHMHLDQKQEQYLNELSYLENHYVNNLIEEEEKQVINIIIQQIDIEEMQIMKEEIKSMLTTYDGISDDISQFKVVLNSVDNIVQKKQLSITQLKEYKNINEELLAIQKRWALFYQDYRNFFSGQHNQQSISQFITQSRLEKIQQNLTNSQINRSQIRTTFKNISIQQQNQSGNKNNYSPIRNTYLNDEINLSRKLSKIEVVHSRVLSSSPLDAKTVLNNSIKRVPKHQNKFLNTQQFHSYIS